MRGSGGRAVGAIAAVVLMAFCGAGLAAAATGAVSGQLKQWHNVTITFDGPASAEDATPNPFTDYRLSVTFAQGERKVVVCGYYAADGRAGETGAGRSVITTLLANSRRFRFRTTSSNHRTFCSSRQPTVFARPVLPCVPARRSMFRLPIRFRSTNSTTKCGETSNRSTEPSQFSRTE